MDFTFAARLGAHGPADGPGRAGLPREKRVGRLHNPPQAPHPGENRLLSQSACLRRNAGISKSSMPPLDKASTLAAAWVRLVRQTLGTAIPW